MHSQDNLCLKIKFHFQSLNAPLVIYLSRLVSFGSSVTCCVKNAFRFFFFLVAISGFNHWLECSWISCSRHRCRNKLIKQCLTPSPCFSGIRIGVYIWWLLLLSKNNNLTKRRHNFRLPPSCTTECNTVNAPEERLSKWVHTDGLYLCDSLCLFPLCNSKLPQTWQQWKKETLRTTQH